MMFGDDLIGAATRLLDECRARQATIATAESCTGGLVSALLTQIPGASVVFTHGFVTYANGAKTQMLGVPKALIEADGAVSEAVARAMARGALARSGADLALAITGVAGPDGGTDAKPVGLVHVAVASKNKPTAHMRHLFEGMSRQQVRLASVGAALRLAATAAHSL
ncbi:MAG: CinA family protein [Alphaproteobacteria bacterium]